MLKRYILNNKKRNFSTASIWIKGGSDMDNTGKKGLNKILCSLLTRGCEGFNNFTFSEYIESYGAELNQEIFEDGISISIKSLNEQKNIIGLEILASILSVGRNSRLVKTLKEDSNLVAVSYTHLTLPTKPSV